MEAPLFAAERLLDDLEQVRVRIEAALIVWDETSRTLGPALEKIRQAEQEVKELHVVMAELWKTGFASKWQDHSRD